MKNITILMLFISCVYMRGFAQDNSEDLEEAYESFSELTRENVHVHLNKTIFIKGEMLGFSAYVINNDTKLLSENSTNLYCIVRNDKDSIVAQKLVKIEKGVANSDFLIDTRFGSGEYKFIAYTNWMRNFSDEYNHYSENFVVLDPDSETVYKPSAVSNDLEIEIHPESGRLLLNTENNVGISVKDHLGLGIGNLEVSVLDDSGQNVTSVTLNESGVGKFLLTPILGKKLNVVFGYNEKQWKVPLQMPESDGLVMSLQEVKDHVILELKTNKESQSYVGNENFKLAIHNGVSLKQILVSLDGEVSKLFKFSYDDLFTGMNIFTLLNTKNQPVSERLFFNSKGVSEPIDLVPETSKAGDSITVKIPLVGVDMEAPNSLSISVLPAQTKSYSHHQNIISSVFVKPYTKKSLEQVGRFLSNIDGKKKYALNLLLLNQEGSNYNWSRIFNNPPDYVYDFDIGINYTVNLNNASTKSLFIYPNADTKSEIVTIDENQKSFTKLGMFPQEDEKIRIGALNANGELGKAQLFLQFEPSNIPEFKTNYSGLTVLKSLQSANTDFSSLEFKGIDNYEQLKEVKLEAKKKYTRIEKIKNATIGRVEEFDDDMRRRYRTFAQYIHTKGFYVEETIEIDPATNDLTIFRIFNRKVTSYNANNTPLIYLDNALLNDFNILNGFKMEIVDYIEVNSAGIGEGIRGGAGVIRIYTDPQKVNRATPKDSYTEYDIPLKFSSTKPFYIPTYSSFSTAFFREFGVVDWIPRATIDNTGSISFKIVDTGVPLNLYVEGVLNNKFVSEVISLKTN